MTRTAPLVIVAAVALSACAADRDDAELAVINASTIATVTTDPPNGVAGVEAIGEFAELYTETTRELRPTLFFDDDPWLDLGVAIDAHRAADEPLEQLLAESPPSDRIDDDLRPVYQSVLDAADDWRSAVADAADELERRSNELAPLAIDWAERIADGADEPPPGEIRELIDAGRDAADRTGQSCTQLANQADVVIDCFAMFAEPGSPDAGDGPAEFTESGTVTIDIDGVSIAIDVVDASGGTGLGDRATFDLGPMTRLWVLPAPQVRNPAAATDATLESAIAWPDDLDGWLDDLDVKVIVNEQIERGERTFRHLAIVSDGDALPLIVNDNADTIDIPAGAPLHLWTTDIDRTPIVATLAIGIPDDEALFVDIADDIIATIRTN